MVIDLLTCYDQIYSFLFSDSILKIVIAYPKALIIDNLYGDGYTHLIIEDVVAHRYCIFRVGKLDNPKYTRHLNRRRVYRRLRTFRSIFNGQHCSIYKDHICYQKHGGRLTIEKLTNTHDGRLLEETWFTRVYSPKNITCINMWNGVCTILVSNDVRKVDYNSKTILPASIYSEKCLLNFSSIPNSMTSQQIHQILRDDIIIVLCKFLHDSRHLF